VIAHVRQPGLVHGGASDAALLGQGEIRRKSISMTVVEKAPRTDLLPELRRLCHYYPGGWLRSACGTAQRAPWEGHYEDECARLGHTICVVCTEFITTA
jgi:hypothetical protein